MERFKLTVLQNNKKSGEFTFTEDEITVGRNDDNDLILPGLDVSRYHFSIKKSYDGFVLMDLDSSNGTRLNGMLIEEHRLKSGDVIQVGKFEILFEELDDDGDGNSVRTFVTTTDRLRKDVTITVEKKILNDIHKIKQERKLELKEGFLGKLKLLAYLDKKKKILILGIGAILLVFLIVFMAISNKKRIKRKIYKQLVVDYNSAASKKTYGYGRVDVIVVDQVKFRFKYNGGVIFLRFAAAGVDSKDELQIRVNNKVFDYVPITPPGKWKSGIKYRISKFFLRDGEINEIVFDQKKYPPKKDAWGIGMVEIIESPLPAPDQDAAKEKFNKAVALYELKDVAYENLYQSLEKFYEVLALLELLKDKPPMYSEAEAYTKKIEKELEEKYQSLMFSVEKALKFNNTKQAIEYLRTITKIIPDPQDPRHQDAVDMLKRLVK